MTDNQEWGVTDSQELKTTDKGNEMRDNRDEGCEMTDNRGVMTEELSARINENATNAVPVNVKENTENYVENKKTEPGQKTENISTSGHGGIEEREGLVEENSEIRGEGEEDTQTYNNNSTAMKTEESETRLLKETQQIDEAVEENSEICGKSGVDITQTYQEQINQKSDLYSTPAGQQEGRTEAGCTETNTRVEEQSQFGRKKFFSIFDRSRNTSMSTKYTKANLKSNLKCSRVKTKIRKSKLADHSNSKFFNYFPRESEHVSNLNLHRQTEPNNGDLTDCLSYP